MDVCKSGPCENGGKCFSDLSKEEFHCSCAKGYEGQTCSERGTSLDMVSPILSDRLKHRYLIYTR